MDFTEYDIRPADFTNYLRYYGPHFNKKLCEFACSYFPKQKHNKDNISKLLSSHNITLNNAKLHDCVFVANWCDNIFMGSSIEDEKHFVLFIKDVFDNEGDLIFNRWYADMAKKGIPIEWSDMI